MYTRRPGQEFRVGSLRGQFQVFRPHQSDVGRAHVQTSQTMATLGFRLLRVQLSERKASHYCEYF